MPDETRLWVLVLVVYLSVCLCPHPSDTLGMPHHSVPLNGKMWSALALAPADSMARPQPDADIAMPGTVLTRYGGNLPPPLRGFFSVRRPGRAGFCPERPNPAIRTRRCRGIPSGPNAQTMVSHGTAGRGAAGSRGRPRQHGHPGPPACARPARWRRPARPPDRRHRPARPDMRDPEAARRRRSAAPVSGRHPRVTSAPHASSPIHPPRSHAVFIPAPPCATPIHRASRHGKRAQPALRASDRFTPCTLRGPSRPILGQ